MPPLRALHGNSSTQSPIVDAAEKLTSIQVNALGQTAILVDGEKISIGAWNSKAARMLFFIATDRSPIHRDEIGVLLWPEFPPARMSSIFHSTCWRMNNALGQGKFLRYDRDAGLYSFDETKVALEYDVAHFEQAVEVARGLSKRPGALKAWKNALGLYGGTYLPGVYEDWALERRRQLSRIHREALKTAAQLCLGMNDVHGAIELYQNTLAEGELAEDTYYQMLQLLTSQNRLGEVNRFFQQLQRKETPSTGADQE